MINRKRKCTGPPPGPHSEAPPLFPLSSALIGPSHTHVTASHWPDLEWLLDADWSFSEADPAHPAASLKRPVRRAGAFRVVATSRVNTTVRRRLFGEFVCCCDACCCAVVVSE